MSLSLPTIEARFEAVAKRLREFRPSPFAGPACPGSVAKAEEELGVTFSQSYRLFLNEFSGGGFPFDIYGIEPQSPPKGNDWYFQSVAGMTESEREDVEPAMPPFLIPFTPNGMGDHWCLDTSRLTGGECPVVFWNHELGEDQELRQTHATFLDWLEEAMSSEDIREYYDDPRNFESLPSGPAS